MDYYQLSSKFMEDLTAREILFKRMKRRPTVALGFRLLFTSVTFWSVIFLISLAFAIPYVYSKIFLIPPRPDTSMVEGTSRSGCTTSAQSMLDLINEYRSNAHLPVLRLDDRLNESTEDKNLDMVKYGYWAHVSPTGIEAWDFMDREGYGYNHAGENLARDFNCNEDVFHAWQLSPAHNENLLDNRFRDMGFSWSGRYATLHLGVR